MSTVSRILCGVDFTEGNRPAFDWAVRLARGRGAELSLVHAVPRDHSFSWNALERLRDLSDLRHAALDAGVTAGVSVQHGNPGNVIALHANARRASLIVIGTNGRTGWGRLKTGSVADRVLRRTSCPTLIVPAKGGPTNAAEAGAIPHVLCAVDFSPASRAALDEAIRLATAERARLSVLHVLKGMESGTVERLNWHFAVPEYRRLRTREARLRLKAAIPSEVRAALDVQIRVMPGVPHQAIVQFASEANADLIVIGGSHRGFNRVLGSTASRVVRGAATPVLVLPARPKAQEAGGRPASEVDVAA